MMKRFLVGASLIGICVTMPVQIVQASADIDVNTPAITQLKTSMQERHAELKEFYENGAIGLTRDGKIAIKDISSVPLPKRAAVNALVAAENQDRNALYREIARANNHPEWEANIRTTFSQRWVERAQAGWWIQNPSGWSKK